MEEYIVVILLAIGVPFAIFTWLAARSIRAKERIEELQARIDKLDNEIFWLKQNTQEATAPTSRWRETARVAEAKPAPATTPIEVPLAHIPAPHIPAPPPIPRAVAEIPVAMAAPAALPMREPEPQPTGPMVPPINWEQFMGVKLLAWIGGLAAFFAVAFFAKYSFDNRLISPEVQMGIGFLVGLALVIGGGLMRQSEYRVLSHTLCATGVVVLYAVTFACRSIYHFEFFTPVATFLLMAMITASAFLLAVRLNAMVVAVLGMLGGFLTPLLLATGQDSPFALFSYIALLDTGLILVALNRRWLFLVALAAAGTVATEIGWAGTFFCQERYFEGNRVLVAMVVLLGFISLHLVAAWWAGRRRVLNWWLMGAPLGLAAAAMVFAAWFTSFDSLAGRPWLLFGFVFLVDMSVAALVLVDRAAAPALPVTGLAVAVLLAVWTRESLTAPLLNAGLTFYLLLAVVHTVFPVWLHRRRGVHTPAWASQLFAPLALSLVLMPIYGLAEVPFIVWPVVLLVNVLAIGLAAITASLLAVLAALVLTLAATFALILKLPVARPDLGEPLLLIGAFSVIFVAASTWLARRFRPELLSDGFHRGDTALAPGNLAAQLPIYSTTFPFLLLIMVTLRLQLVDPSPVFGLAMLLVMLLLGVATVFSVAWLPATGLACLAALETIWHTDHFARGGAAVPLAWYVAFLVVFSIHPFVFLRRLGGTVVPWATAAMAGPTQFFLVHHVVKTAYPNPAMGLLPLAFALLPLLSFVVILRRTAMASVPRLGQLAWFGGVALFFLTLVFPIQFDRQWITIGWALEGAAILWLFHRLPHAGLRLVGVGLLTVAFLRLAVNPAVLDYQTGGAMAVLNWYLYTYGLVTACLFAGARLLAPPRHLMLGIHLPPVLAGLGTVLAFLLVNIEIADYFSEADTTLVFQFSGNFARDMTYSIAWAVFALVLLVVGIARRSRIPRFASLGLLGVTVLKLFLHDLANLNQLYRIGAFLAVASIAMLASFAYQRFYARSSDEAEPNRPG